MELRFELQKGIQEEDILAYTKCQELLHPNRHINVLRNITGCSSVKITICFLIVNFLLSSGTICIVAEGKRDTPIAINPENPYYFVDTKGKSLMLFGDYTWETFSGVNSDYGKFFESLKLRGLNLGRVWLWWGCEELPSGNGFPAETKLHIEPLLREGSGFAFAMANNEKLFAYLPEGGEAGIDLSGMNGKISFKWYDPLTGKFAAGNKMKSMTEFVFSAPDNNDWVLIIKAH